MFVIVWLLCGVCELSVCVIYMSCEFGIYVEYMWCSVACAVSVCVCYMCGSDWHMCGMCVCGTCLRCGDIIVSV